MNRPFVMDFESIGESIEHLAHFKIEFVGFGFIGKKTDCCTVVTDSDGHNIPNALFNAVLIEINMRLIERMLCTFRVAWCKHQSKLSAFISPRSEATISL